ncbi:Bcr/CflA family multidrug efflux MFS transporter [Chitinasiproducens palmae]|uniref:Bcr/CflA family efflux transporter n=1 Tax=Chitinasiproducens palmae TaxID=1770053 RepID=A0A1H2PMD2_9BURK|nr:Bcr/CflA family multidrug efflux MFS transporter [Chitinasiproducens palmae]SDV47743.1 MFS transporter, DHA1 family, bicyclomycin/chloramphenicol resistance protein [Chitinasiproducens palmae]
MSHSAAPTFAGSRRRLILLLGALAACGPISVDMYLPALPAIAQGFGVDQAAAQLTLTLFMIGFAAGMLLYGPLSDAYGRRRLLIAGVAIYALASLGCAFAPSIGVLIGLRFVQALGAGAAAVLARAIARDAHAPSEAARVMSILGIVTAVGPLLAPLIGGQMLLLGGWRAVFGLLAAYGALSFVAVIRKVPETWPPERRAKAALRNSLHAYGRIARDPLALGYLMCACLSFAAMFAYLAGTPFVYIEYYGVSPQHYGLLFAGNIVGMVALNFMNSRLVGRVGTLPITRVVVTVHLIAALATAFVSITGLGGLPALAVCLFFVVSTVAVLGANCVTDLMHRYPSAAGAAAALFGALQFVCGACVASLVGVFSNGTPFSMGALIGACGALAFAGYLLIAGRTRAALRR